MQKLDILDDYCYVEFGAGKGLFSHLVADANKKAS